MQRTLVGLICAAFCATAALGTVAAQAPQTAPRPVIKIGVILPLSGNNGYLGENARDGLLLRAKEIPSDSRFEYRFIFEDDANVPAKVNSAARKLKSIDKVDVLMSLWGDRYNIVTPVLRDSQIVHISLDSWSEPAGYPFDVVLGSSQDVYAQKMAEAVSAIGAKTATMFSVASPAEKMYNAALAKALSERNIQLLQTDYTNFDTRDFRTYVLRIRELNPDIFLSTAQLPMGELVLRQMREIGYTPILGASSANLLDISDKSLIEGAFYTLAPPNPAWFEQKFKERYGRTPLYPSTHGYDAATLLVAACEKLPGDKKPFAEDLIAQIRSLKDFPTALGTVTFQTPNRLPTPVALYQIKYGMPTLVSAEELAAFWKDRRPSKSPFNKP